MLSTIITTIQEHLDQQPTDWQARRELADLLEEAEQLAESRLQRWLVRWERAPAWEPRFKPYDGKHWYWWGPSHADDPSRGPLGQYSILNRALLAPMLPYTYTWGGYSTRQAAERELLRVLQEQDWPDLQLTPLAESQ